MRLLVRPYGIRYSPILLLLLVLAILGVIGQHALLLDVGRAAGAGEGAVYRLRRDVEPAIVLGGIVVSRNRHTIAGGVLGCASGAALGAASAAALGLATGGIGLAALPPAAGVGCVVVGALGVATGYPLDNWALELE